MNLTIPLLVEITINQFSSEIHFVYLHPWHKAFLLIPVVYKVLPMCPELSVTYVSGTFCYLCVRNFLLPMCPELSVTYVSVTFCYLCVRNFLLPMCPDHTHKLFTLILTFSHQGRRNSNSSLRGTK
jgi:hypothetical protein